MLCPVSEAEYISITYLKTTLLAQIRTDKESKVASTLLLSYLHDLWRVMLHFHDYVLRLLICINSLVEDFDDAHRWKLTRVTV